MSFSSAAKEDLVKIRLRSDLVRLAALSGLVHTCGALTIGRKRGAVFTTETLAVGKFIVSLAAGIRAVPPESSVARIGLAAAVALYSFVVAWNVTNLTLVAGVS